MLFANNFVGRGRLVLIAAVCILLAACSSQVEVPLPTATFTTIPTTIPSQTPTLSPTATPLPPDLPFSGVFYNRRESPNHLYILNSSLHNWETIEFPAGSHVGLLKSALSPDQKWVAFKTGSIEGGDIAINQMYLPDRSVITIAELLSDRYPDDLLDSLDEVVFADSSDLPPELESWDVPLWSLRTFKEYLGRPAWSPDGRFLAFNGQIDGPASDLYVYDIGTDEIFRITADENLVGSFRWSPEGDNLVYEHYLPGWPIAVRTLHIAGLEDRNLTNPVSLRKGTFWYAMDWFSNNDLLITQANDGAPNASLDVLNIETAQFTTIWPSYFFESAINYVDQTVMLYGHLEYDYEDGEEIGTGLYYVDSGGNWDFVLDSFVTPYYWNGLNSDFLVKTGEAVYTYSPDNGLVKMAELGFNASMVISPDSRWVVLTDFVSAQIYGPDDKMVLDIPSKIGNILWGPNSAGFFYLDDDWLHYVSLPDGEITVLEPCPQRACWIYKGEIVWLED